jgi:hypothetical protein
MSQLQDVYIKLRNDVEFKDAFQKNPKQALLDAGFKLSDKELNMILKQQGLSDEGGAPLGGRINK